MENERTLQLAEELARQHTITRRGETSSEEIVERLVFSMINEGAHILEEGIAYRGSDIDVVWTAGYGFPDHRGGPMHMADTVGLRKVIERLDQYAGVRGNEHGYWTVAPLLRKLARGHADRDFHFAPLGDRGRGIISAIPLQ